MRFLLYFALVRVALHSAANSFGGLREYLLQRPDCASFLEQAGEHVDKERPLFASVRLETRLRGEHDEETLGDVEAVIRECQEILFSPAHLEKYTDILSL